MAEKFPLPHCPDIFFLYFGDLVKFVAKLYYEYSPHSPLLPGRFLGRIRNIQYWPIMSQGGAGWLRSVSFPNDIEIRPDHWIILPVKWVQMWAACQVNVKHCCVTHYKYIYHSPPPAPRLHNGIKYIIIIYFPNFPLIPFKMVPGQ